MTLTSLPKLEVGSGTRPQPGHLHLDINATLPDLDFVGEMDAIPADDNSFSEVRATHVIEHIPLHRAKLALREWLRVLAPGGMAHIDTPNIERNMAFYQNGMWREDFASLHPEEQERCSLNGEPNRSLHLIFKIFSSDAQWDIHYANYTPELLVALCLDAGFARAEVYQTEPSLIVRAFKGEGA